ncbi:antibiotic biosynthesis monooxygenase [Demequina sp. NBRC 110055]|uniref:antibiotic biosynthesis monooxygenase family protein n=1 Tax=Demequina sp. NBRC 110055 TaxID=1570344 RepID=UPI001F1623BE|nr:antibiotic biosynthesis monooxygenase [Demequina sp. NBRC 110055]
MTDIVESVVLPVRPGMEAEFESTFREASALISRQPGYLGHSLRRGVEHPSTYLLTVTWTDVDAHEVGFRGSADYQEWKRLLHCFYDPFPVVLHYGEDLLA